MSLVRFCATLVAPLTFAVLSWPAIALAQSLPVYQPDEGRAAFAVAPSGTVAPSQVPGLEAQVIVKIADSASRTVKNLLQRSFDTPPKSAVPAAPGAPVDALLRDGMFFEQVTSNMKTLFTLFLEDKCAVDLLKRVQGELTNAPRISAVRTAVFVVRDSCGK